MKEQQVVIPSPGNRSKMRDGMREKEKWEGFDGGNVGGGAYRQRARRNRTVKRQ